MSEIYEVTAQALQEIRERITEYMGLQTFSENRHWCWRDVQRQSVPQSGSSDRKSSIADGWKTGAWDNKRWCRCRAETLTSLVSSENSQLKLGALRHLQPVQLCHECWRCWSFCCKHLVRFWGFVPTCLWRVIFRVSTVCCLRRPD